MKLYFVFPVTGPNNGVKIISSYIKNNLVSENKIEVITIDTAQAEDYSSFGKFSFKKISKIFKILTSLFKIKKKDLVYLNFTPKGFAFYRDLLVLMVGCFKASNVTIHIHANGLEDKIKGYNKWLFAKTKIIVINEAQYRALNGYAQNCFLLPNALPDYYDSRTITYRETGKINLIFLSNISKEKGIYRLEKLAKIVHDRNIKCIINVFGGILSEQDKIVVDKLKTQYTFLTYHGALKNEQEKFEALQLNDALIFLSDENYEVSPLVYIEALMSGLPVFTTKQVVAKSMFEKNVAFILNKDLDNFEDILNNFITNKKELKVKARDTYLNTYSFTTYMNELKNILLNA
jgi:glycosyltransferase involved in cell wall biosynthesis